MMDGRTKTWLECKPSNDESNEEAATFLGHVCPVPLNRLEYSLRIELY